jgi:hypothetical protein
MVWKVLGSSKGVWEAYGIRAKGEEEAPSNKNEFFLEIHKRGGVTLLGGCTIWGRGEEWRGINEGRGVERHWDEAKR